jgi:HSP20 family protein
MTIIRYQPWTLFARLHNGLGEGSARARAFAPNVDIIEEDARYVLRADLPGVKPADIHVTVAAGVLTLRAERNTEKSGSGGNVAHFERGVGVYERRFALPENADAAAIAARSSDGVLELSIPKIARREPRRISIEAA